MFILYSVRSLCQQGKKKKIKKRPPHREILFVITLLKIDDTEMFEQYLKTDTYKNYSSGRLGSCLIF